MQGDAQMKVAQYDAVILRNAQVSPVFYAVEEDMCFTAA